MADPRQAVQIRSTVAEITEAAQAEVRAASTAYTEAFSYVRTLHLRGQLDEVRLQVFARANDFDKIVVALSLICNLPVGVIEPSLVDGDPDQLLLVAANVTDNRSGSSSRES